MNDIFQTESALTKEEIEKELNKIDVNLPQEYKSFLHNFNGGRPSRTFFELRKFDLNKSNSNYYINIDYFFTVNELEEIWNNTQQDLNPENLFPIAEADGGMIICCKKGDTDMAEIFFYDYNFGILKLTNSLKAFIDLLIPESDVNYKQYGLDV